jgi:hypothetical protein
MGAELQDISAPRAFWGNSRMVTCYQRRHHDIQVVGAHSSNGHLNGSRWQTHDRSRPGTTNEAMT